MYSKSELSKKLRENLPDTSLINSLKISYRPYICPFDQLLNIVERKKAIFDIGCGSGMFLKLIAEYRDPIKLGGIEISEDLINNAGDLLKTYHLPLFLKTFDGLNLPEQIKEYDYIFLIDVFHHVPKQNQEEFIRRIFEEMKPGAILIFKDIDASKFLVLFNKIHDAILSKEIGNEISCNKAIHLLESKGFKIDTSKYIRTLWYPHYLIIGRK